MFIDSINKTFIANPIIFNCEIKPKLDTKLYESHIENSKINTIVEEKETNIVIKVPIFKVVYQKEEYEIQVPGSSSNNNTNKNLNSNFHSD